MAGYAQRVIRLAFPGLTDDDAGDPVWVVIRNPRLMPPHELTPKGGGGIGPDGMPTDLAAAEDATYEVLSRLVIGWRVYDATQPIQLDATGNDITQQVLLPQGEHSVANCKKLPMEIVNRLGEEMRTAANPR